MVSEYNNGSQKVPFKPHDPLHPVNLRRFARLAASSGFIAATLGATVWGLGVRLNEEVPRAPKPAAAATPVDHSLYGQLQDRNTEVSYGTFRGMKTLQFFLPTQTVGVHLPFNADSGNYQTAKKTSTLFGIEAVVKDSSAKGITIAYSDKTHGELCVEYQRVSENIYGKPQACLSHAEAPSRKGQK